MADIFDAYAMADAVGRDVRAPRRAAGGRTSRCSPRCSRSPAPTCGSGPTSWPGSSPTAGVTFAYAGEERPFPLDLVPRIIDADEWDLITPGGPPAGAGPGGVPRRRLRRRRRCFADGVVPRRLIATSAHFHRAGVRHRARPTGCASTSAASTWSATRLGEFRVLEDNLRIPSGVSYVIENRRAMTPDAARPLRRGAGAPGRRLPGPAAGRAAGRGAGRRRRPVRRGPHPGRLQRRLLRARAAGPADGRGAGRGPRPASAAATGCGCARPRASGRSTSSTAGSTTSSSTRCTSGPTR